MDCLIDRTKQLFILQRLLYRNRIMERRRRMGGTCMGI